MNTNKKKALLTRMYQALEFNQTGVPRGMKLVRRSDLNEMMQDYETLCVLVEQLERQHIAMKKKLNTLENKIGVCLYKDDRAALECIRKKMGRTSTRQLSDSEIERMAKERSRKQRERAKEKLRKAYSKVKRYEDFRNGG